ncbi:hypothetical protein PTKIN_Ptkin05aG0144200 [Pterospermum kingtungense]
MFGLWPLEPYLGRFGYIEMILRLRVKGILDIFKQPCIVKSPCNCSTIRLVLGWSQPPSGSVKFNVDGSSLGNSNPTGIGGVLRNHLGSELFWFSKLVGVMEANLAELLAVREAFAIFITMAWASDHSLIVESDSKVVVCWVANPQLAP